MSKEEADKIMERWDYERNIDNNGDILSPKNISKGSDGFDRKGYWFKCIDYPEHGSELKSICAFTGGNNGRINCNKCNTIHITHPELALYFVNKEDALKYSRGSNKSIPMKCPNCGYEKEINIHKLINKGFSCPKCSEGYYPEKFMFNVLEQLLNKDFQTQLSKTTFDWCNNFRYDFYINKINCIIETHGSQHYEEVNGSWGGSSLIEIQNNDKNKELLANINGIKRYIVIDCRESTIEWIKKEIINSELPKLLNFKEEDIDWLKCHKYAISSRVKEVCNLWNNGIIKLIDIVNNLKISIDTVKKYLKQGAKLDWCNYIHNDKVDYTLKYKKVICLTTDIIFNSVKEASNKYKVGSPSISACCRNKVKSAGKSLDGIPLIWMYYDDYLNNY